MKIRISVTVDKETLDLLNSLVKSKKYRNKSHAVESAIRMLKETEEGEKKD